LHTEGREKKKKKKKQEINFLKQQATAASSSSKKNEINFPKEEEEEEKGAKVWNSIRTQPVQIQKLHNKSSLSGRKRFVHKDT
jgi:hypothetical protein